MSLFWEKCELFSCAAEIMICQNRRREWGLLSRGGETEASPCTTITVKGVTFGVLRPTIFRLFFFSLSIQLCKKKKKHCLPSLDHTTPLSPLPFSLSARPLLPSECSRLMHPPLFSLLFFFLLSSQSSVFFFPPQSAPVASSFNHGLWNKRGYGRQQWTHFIRRRKERMDKTIALIVLTVKSEWSQRWPGPNSALSYFKTAGKDLNKK